MSVAIFGSTGYVGKFVTSSFIEALKDRRLKEVKILTTRHSEIIDGYEKDGAKICLVDFSKPDTVKSNLSGIDAVISTLGTGPGTAEVKHCILEATASSGVKIYIPSEFGTNHYTRCKNYKHAIFEDKKKHFNEAQAKGLKTIRMICGLIMEASFGKWFGLDTKAEVWTLVGKGETPVAVTAEKDIGRFTLEAVIMAIKDPTKFPDFIEFYSDIKTMKDYALEFDKVAGRKTTLKFTPLKYAIEEYEKSVKFEYLLQILFEEGGFNAADSKGNQLLNPGEKVWKLKKISEHAKETHGRPWKDYE